MVPIMINKKQIVSIIIGLSLSLTATKAVANVVAVVSAKSPVSTLSKNEIVDIFLGKANHFPDGLKAVPIDQVESSVIHKEFYLKFADKSPAQIKAFWSKMIFTGRGQPPLEMSNSMKVKKFIAKHPDAIGYIEQKQVDHSVKVVLTK
jgi:ABC-type phosphate transport system substrate-binding protein